MTTWPRKWWRMIVASVVGAMWVALLAVDIALVSVGSSQPVPLEVVLLTGLAVVTVWMIAEGTTRRTVVASDDLGAQIAALEDFNGRALEGLSARMAALEVIAGQMVTLSGLSERVEALENVAARIAELESRAAADPAIAERIADEFVRLLRAWRADAHVSDAARPPDAATPVVGIDPSVINLLDQLDRKMREDDDPQ